MPSRPPNPASDRLPVKKYLVRRQGSKVSPLPNGSATSMHHAMCILSQTAQVNGDRGKPDESTTVECTDRARPAAGRSYDAGYYDAAMEYRPRERPTSSS